MARIAFTVTVAVIFILFAVTHGHDPLNLDANAVGNYGVSALKSDETVEILRLPSENPKSTLIKSEHDDSMLEVEPEVGSIVIDPEDIEVVDESKSDPEFDRSNKVRTFSSWFRFFPHPRPCRHHHHNHDHNHKDHEHDHEHGHDHEHDHKHGHDHEHEHECPYGNDMILSGDDMTPEPLSHDGEERKDFRVPVGHERSYGNDLLFPTEATEPMFKVLTFGPGSDNRRFSHIEEGSPFRFPHPRPCHHHHRKHGHEEHEHEHEHDHDHEHEHEHGHNHEDEEGKHFHGHGGDKHAYRNDMILATEEMNTHPMLQSSEEREFHHYHHHHHHHYHHGRPWFSFRHREGMKRPFHQMDHEEDEHIGSSSMRNIRKFLDHLF